MERTGARASRADVPMVVPSRVVATSGEGATVAIEKKIEKDGQMTTTIIEYNSGRTVTRIGTAGFTVTSTRIGENVNVLMEFDFPTREECAALVGSLLFQLEELHGENLVAQCIAHYVADSKKKPVRRTGKRDEYRIRGYKGGRR